MANPIKILRTGFFRMDINEKMAEKSPKARFKVGFRINSIMVFVSGADILGSIFMSQLFPKNFGI